MVIANFTPDPIPWTHAGICGVVKPGEIVEMEANRGNFLLNKHDKRGLLTLKFGDNIEEKRAAAMEIWERFWRRQIINFNQDNERRKNTQKEYVEPSNEVLSHAQKLGIELVGPWTIRQTDDAAVAALRKEKNDLEVKVETLTRMVSDLTDAMKTLNIPIQLRTAAEKIDQAKQEAADEKGAESSNKSAADENAKLISEFTTLKTEKFGEWVMTNLDRLQSPEYPSAVLALVKEKWGRLIEGQFPVVN